jgi:hypothetical protein
LSKIQNSKLYFLADFHQIFYERPAISINYPAFSISMLSIRKAPAMMTDAFCDKESLSFYQGSL